MSNKKEGGMVQLDLNSVADYMSEFIKTLDSEAWVQDSEWYKFSLDVRFYMDGDTLACDFANPSLKPVLENRDEPLGGMGNERKDR